MPLQDEVDERVQCVGELQIQVVVLKTSFDGREIRNQLPFNVPSVSLWSKKKIKIANIPFLKFLKVNEVLHDTLIFCIKLLRCVM